jgi:thioredoxin reductase (NADPH)
MKKTFCLFYFLCISLSASMPSQKVDAIVLGGGSAGLTSAIYLGRAGFSTLVLEGPVSGGAITQSNAVYNWPGYKETSGSDLTEHMQAQARASGAVLSKEEAIEVNFTERPFSVIAQDVYDKSKKRKILADVCIVTLGACANKLEIPGETAYWSKGVYTCAVCDGSLYKDKVVAVVGGGDASLLEADYLAGLAKKVYILNRKDTFKGVDKIREERILALPNVQVIYDVKIKEIKGDGKAVDSLQLVNKESKESSLAVDALFLAIGATPNTHIFAKQLELDSNGYITLKKGTETSIAGVFAAGDVADPIFKQAIIASGEGAKAALQASDYLRLASLKKSEPLPTLKVENKEPKILKAIEVSSLSQLKEIVSSGKGLVLIDFYATWCGPCKYLGQFTDVWAQELKDKATLCKVNVDLARELAIRYKVQSMPTVVVLSPDGQEVARKIGVEEIMQYINRLKN